MAQNDYISNVELDYKGKKFKLSTKFRDGNNELIFLIHGLGCSKEAFEDIWNLLEFEKYSILTVDLIGFGNSSKPKDFSYEIKEHAEICKLLLDKFPHPVIHIVAHSMGGGVGLLLAEKLEDRLKTFISVEGNLRGEDCGVLSRKTSSFSLEEFVESKFDKLKNSSKSSKELSTRLWSERLEKASSFGFHKSAKSLVALSDSNRLLNIFNTMSANKAYFYGDRSSKHKVLEGIKNIEKTLISNSAHFIMTDNPDEFYRELYRVLDGK